jgi:hypothetical protein
LEFGFYYRENVSFHVTMMHGELGGRHGVFTPCVLSGIRPDTSGKPLNWGF